MKILFLVFLFPVWSLFGQDSTFPDGKLPHFELTVRVCSLKNKTKKLRDVRVTVSEINGDLVFEGCTDENGEAYIDSTYILRQKSYVVRVAAEGVHEDRNGSKFTTIGLRHSQHFVIDMALLNSECWYFPCYEPSDTTREADHEWVINDIASMKIGLWEEYEIPLTELAVWIHYETWDEEERLMREAKLLLEKLKKRLPGIAFDEEIGIEYHPAHAHDACIRIVRLG